MLFVNILIYLWQGKIEMSFIATIGLGIAAFGIASGNPFFICRGGGLMFIGVLPIFYALKLNNIK